MGRLIPIFEDTGRGKHFEGKFRDDVTGIVGSLHVENHFSDIQGEVLTTETKFVALAEDQE